MLNIVSPNLLVCTQLYVELPCSNRARQHCQLQLLQSHLNIHEHVAELREVACCIRNCKDKLKKEHKKQEGCEAAAQELTDSLMRHYTLQDLRRKAIEERSPEKAMGGAILDWATLQLNPHVATGRHPTTPTGTQGNGPVVTHSPASGQLIIQFNSCITEAGFEPGRPNLSHCTHTPRCQSWRTALASPALALPCSSRPLLTAIRVVKGVSEKELQAMEGSSIYAMLTDRRVIEHAMRIPPAPGPNSLAARMQWAPAGYGAGMARVAGTRSSPRRKAQAASYTHYYRWVLASILGSSDAACLSSTAVHYSHVELSLHWTCLCGGLLWPLSCMMCILPGACVCLPCP